MGRIDIGSNNPQAGDGLGQVMAFVSTITESSHTKYPRLNIDIQND